ncbi:hypothetical protein ACA910_008732 [Epithemia clementina (nom. ined.)]
MQPDQSNRTNDCLFSTDTSNSESKISLAPTLFNQGNSKCRNITPTTNTGMESSQNSHEMDPGSTSNKPINDVCTHIPELLHSHVHEIIKTTVPDGQSKAYLDAFSTDPTLVHIETDPAMFVRSCSYNLDAGAQRLCQHWTERVKLFGPERAFLPLTLTGTGALTNDDVQTVLAGYPVLIPDAISGQKCILADPRKWITSATTESKLRAWFYVHRLLCQYDHTQVDGLISLVVMVTPHIRDLNMVDWDFYRRLSSVMHVFPVRQVQIHLLSMPHKLKPDLAADVITHSRSIIRQCLEETKMPFYTHVHTGTELGQMLKKLMAVGLSEESVPLCLGGAWKYELWYKRCQERKLWEREHFKDRLLKEPPPTQKCCGQHLSSHDHESGKALSGDKLDSLSTKIGESKEQQRLAKKRMSDLISSRHKRERQRQRLQTLQSESTSLFLENRRLTANQHVLENLLRRAETLIDTLRPGVERRLRQDGGHDG